MPNEKVTYVTYNEGVEAKHLHLGNLVHDYTKPNSLDPYVEKSYTDIADPVPEWARLRSLSNFALTLGKGYTEDEDESSDEEAEGERYRVAAAAKTIQLEIKEASTFFKETTLKSAAAKQWLTSHLSAAETLSPHPPPQVWMLTGLILMTHATWTSLQSTQSFTVGLPAPFDPTGVTAIRRSSVSDHVRPTFGFEEDKEAKHIPGATIRETGKYPGTRGWAAQWERVDVKVVGVDKWKGGADNQVMLGTKKGSEKMVVVELDAGEYAGNKAPPGSDDEEYWDTFLDKIEEFE